MITRKWSKNTQDSHVGSGGCWSNVELPPGYKEWSNFIKKQMNASCMYNFETQVKTARPPGTH